MKRTLMMLMMSWIFLPSTYSHTPPVRPHVEGLPDQRQSTRVYIWRQYREPGYIRNEYRRW